MNKKRILVACGTGIATSTVVTMRIKETLQEKKIDAEVEQCKVSELPSKINSADLVVTTTSFTSDKIPVIRALSFLTGVNVEEDLKKIVEILQN